MKAMRAQWPLVGRAGELRKMKGLLENGASGLVLAGAQGIGKTRLAQECLRLAERSGAAVVRVAATRAAAPLPLGVFDPLLPAFRQGEGDRVDDRIALIRRCAAYLVKEAGNRRLVLFADDAHLLDEASAILVHQLAVTGAAFVVVTTRTGENAPDPIVALWKDDAVERLEVTGLRADTVEELLPAVLCGPVDRATTHRLTVLCKGNVLFLRELVIGALEDGTLRNDVGVWRLLRAVSPSSRMTELIENRLQGLTPEERRLLEVLSFGEPLTSGELTALGSTVLAERLERRGLIVSETSGRRLEIRLGHPIYGEVLRDRIPAVRAKEIARSLAEMVEATGARRREDTLRIATWRLEGGPADPQLMLNAALTARWRYDFPLAERLARAAVQSGAGFDANLLAAQLATLQGRGAEAESALATLADAASDDRQRGLVAIARLDNRVFHLGRIDIGIQMAERAEASISDPAWRNEIAAKQSSVVLGQSGPRAGAEVSLPLLEVAKDRALVWAGINSAFALGRLGRLTEARKASDLARQAHLGLSEPISWYPWIHAWHIGEILRYEGGIEESEALATEYYQQGMVEDSLEAQAWFSWQLSMMVGDRGFPRAAALRGRAAVGLFHQLGQPRFEHFALTPLALALALTGDGKDAEETLRRMDALGLPNEYYWTADTLQARAWTAITNGHLQTGQQYLKEAAAVGADIGDLIGETSSLHGLARIGYADDVADELLRLAQQVEGRLASARAAHAVALASKNGSGLGAVSQTFEEIGALLLAAEAAADAAVAWHRSGDPRRGAVLEQRSNTLAELCETPKTPALLAVQGRSQLTRAERAIALLAVGGKPNREIAGQLALSVRTVENHLQHVYEKLGISRRTDLAEALESDTGHHIHHQSR